MTVAIHPLFETPLPRGWKLVTVDDIKSQEKSSCVAGPFGSSISSKYFVESGVPIIRGGNLRNDLTRFVPEGFAFVSEQQATKYKAQHVSSGDLVFTCWGTIGQVGLIPKYGPFPEYIISNKQLKLRPNVELADPEYLFFYFAGPKMVQHVLGKAIGAAVPGINLGILKALPVVLPPLPIQQRIAGILSAYDELIENSQQRIKILESMARALYREWFVHFGFPGHESVARFPCPLGEIPQGWEVKRIDEALSFESGRTIKKEERESGDIPVYGANGIIGGTANNPMAAECIIMGKIGSCGALHRSHNPCWVTNNAFLVKPAAIQSWELAWQTLLEIDFGQYVGGAANPYMPINAFGQHEVLVPPIDVQIEFQKRAAPLRRLVETLSERVDNLRRTRDLLLPRLLSGRIDVEAIAS